MARLSIDSLERSRTAGMATISGKGYLEVAKKLIDVDGVDGIEHDIDNKEYVVTYNKSHWTTEGFKDLYKDNK